jgi:alkylhydroperoxidase family enzyme
MIDDSDTAGATQFLPRAEVSEVARAILDEDRAEIGFEMNASRLWAYHPEVMIALFDVMGEVTSRRPFTLRERGILVTACASSLGDSYCSLAWGTKLAGEAGPRFAAGVLSGDDSELSAPERAMAAWARQVARDPNGTSAHDVQALRDAGFADADIFAMTVYVALRLAFSTVNDALGVSPDAELTAVAPADVLGAVTFGRPVAAGRPPDT